MGRTPTMDAWRHFQKLEEEGHVPGSSYWYVVCRHCALGFAQKQLPSAPERITGRRSAMRSHLRICPMYGAQYAKEEQAMGHVQTQGSAQKRKRKGSGGRSKLGMMEAWQHFDRLDSEGHIGNSNFFYAVCKYCQQAYDQATDEQKPPLMPKKIVGRREKLCGHLELCPHFDGELPPLERKVRVRSASVPHDAAKTAEAVAAASTDQVAATEGGGATTTTVLDEWQYFTRMERKDGVYYNAGCNFCLQAYDAAPESVKAAMQLAIVTGRTSIMLAHLAKCPHVPKDLAFVRSAAARLSPPDIVKAVAEARAPLPPQCAKRNSAMHMFPYDDFTVNRALMEFLLEHYLPFEWVDSSSATRLFRALAPATNMVPIPSATELRGRVLNTLYKSTLLAELSQLQEPVPAELCASAFYAGEANTLEDSPARPWPVMLHCTMALTTSDEQELLLPMVEGVATNGKAAVPLSFVREQSGETDIHAVAHNHGLEIARWLEEHFRLCADNARLHPAAVVLPFNSNTQRTVGVLRGSAQWSQVVYLANVEDLFYFPLLKLLSSAEMLEAVTSLIELWQLESIRLCVVDKLLETTGSAHSNPFFNWRSCATLIGVFLDDNTFEGGTKPGSSSVKRLVDGALDRPLLERVHSLLGAFVNIFSGCETRPTLSEVLAHLKTLWTAAGGIVTVQRALEVVWAQMEQPLFALAHALDPHLRLRGLSSTDVTKFSALSDVSVDYFVALFGRKPISLRGEMTAYLHQSQPAFTSDVVREFPVVEDYFRYLRDDYPSLSMLMQVLNSLSPFTRVSHSSRSPEKSSSSIYSGEEQEKLEYLRSRWRVAGAASLKAKETESRIPAHSDRSGAAMLNARVVVAEWTTAMSVQLQKRGVDFALLDEKFNGTTQQERRTDGATSRASSVTIPKLSSLSMDDEVTYPSVCLHDPFSKVLLKHLFKEHE